MHVEVPLCECKITAKGLQHELEISGHQPRQDTKEQ